MSIEEVLISLIKDYKSFKSADRRELPRLDSQQLLQQIRDKSRGGGCHQDSKRVPKKQVRPLTKRVLSK